MNDALEAEPKAPLEALGEIAWPRPIGGLEKILANLRILGRVARLAVASSGSGKVQREYPGEKGLGAFLRSFLTVFRMLKQRKYVAFGDKIFFELYAPRFPSEHADQMLEATVLNLTSDPTGKRGFIPNLDIAITGRCMFRCEHCYAADALDKKDHVTVEQWKSVIDYFQDKGVGVISFVGGEPLIRFKDMVTLTRHARKRSDVWTVTTGWGLNRDKAAELADAGLVGAAVSLDHYDPDKHNAFRRNPKAYDAAVKSLELFAGAGVLPALAICSTRDIVEGDGLYRFLELAKELKVGFVQIVEPIRSGEYLGDHDVALTEAELRKLQQFQRDINQSSRYRGYPSVVTRSSVEDSDIGVGCGAGGNTFLYVDPKGNLQPCPVLNITSGNVFDDGLDTALNRMQEMFPHPIANGPICPANALYHHIAEARERSGGRLPIPYNEAKKICGGFSSSALPPLYGGKLGVRSGLAVLPSPRDVERIIPAERLVQIRRAGSKPKETPPAEEAQETT
jgi:MoaA/NifB/PqqE/SkfB family radical SAM enzyme